jgi:hypothetical protein
MTTHGLGKASSRSGGQIYSHAARGGTHETAGENR